MKKRLENTLIYSAVYCSIFAGTTSIVLLSGLAISFVAWDFTIIGLSEVFHTLRISAIFSMGLSIYCIISHNKKTPKAKL